MNYNTRVLSDSIKFYLPRTEGYLEIIRHIGGGAMYLIGGGAGTASETS
jgi:hypothetical protein